ncbi:hypothetical protein [Ornithinibacillus halotolerans]|uniref:DUF1516 family protein n=1 Tax=Ornithinibacillus halotolerans TaxID=1274357 RepID=A0A916W6E6_9BACI|nr:hypothetical protein [Ornithinibacillus halotolerans]GGA69967.1 hypothetical protein GCM10008025_12420 [Ornithinibacillus halotolerans]
MVIVTCLLISLYALLIAIAAMSQWKDQGFRIHRLFFMIVALMIFLSIWAPNKILSLWILIISFISLHVLAIAEGLINNGKLRLRHHIIRFGVHVLLIILVIQFVM